MTPALRHILFSCNQRRTVAPTTWDPANSRGHTLSDANLTVTSGATVQQVQTYAAVSSGKFYCEFTGFDASGNSIIGINRSTGTFTGFPGQNTGGYGYYGNTGNKYINGAGATAYGATYSTTNVIGMALDLDNGTLEFLKNGVSQGVMATGIPLGTYFVVWDDGTGVGGFTVTANFGLSPFAFGPPAGFAPAFGL